MGRRKARNRLCAVRIRRKLKATRPGGYEGRKACAMIINYFDAVKMLGNDYEGALDVMWESEGFGETVELTDFLRAWTVYIRETTVQGIKLGLID